jgi:hypothetical protein
VVEDYFLRSCKTWSNAMRNHVSVRERECAFYFYFWSKECNVLRERNVLKEVVVVVRESGT